MFLQGKGQIGVRKNCPQQTCAPVSANGSEYTVKVNGKSYAIKLEGDKASVNGKSYDVSVKEGIENQLQLLLVPAQVKKLKPAFLVTY